VTNYHIGPHRTTSDPYAGMLGLPPWPRSWPWGRIFWPWPWSLSLGLGLGLGLGVGLELQTQALLCDM